MKIQTCLKIRNFQAADDWTFFLLGARTVTAECLRSLQKFVYFGHGLNWVLRSCQIRITWFVSIKPMKVHDQIMTNRKKLRTYLFANCWHPEQLGFPLKIHRLIFPPGFPKSSHYFAHCSKSSHFNGCSLLLRQRRVEEGVHVVFQVAQTCGEDHVIRHEFNAVVSCHLQRFRIGDVKFYQGH